MRARHRTPFSVKVNSPSTGLNTRLPPLGPGALGNYGAYATAASGLESVAALRDATKASNVRFEDGVACNAPGYINCGMTPTPDGPINLIAQANLSSQLVNIATRSPIIGTTQSLYAQNSANGYLLVFAGPDQTMYDTSTASLAATFTDTFGTGSNTPTFAWTQVSGPSGATITSPTAQSTTVTGLAPGSYVFQVMASDSGTNVTSQVKVTVVYGKARAYVYGSIPHGSNCALCVLPNGLVYMANNSYGYAGGPACIQVYNPVANLIVATIIDSALVSNAGPLVYNPSDGLVYCFASQILQINPSSNLVVGRVNYPTGWQLGGTAVALPSGNIVVDVYNNGAFSTGLMVLYTSTLTCSSVTVSPGGGYFQGGVCYNSSNGLCYIWWGNGNYITSFNPSSLVAADIAITGGPTVTNARAITFYCPANNTIYTGSGSPQGLFSYNPTTGATGLISTGFAPVWGTFNSHTSLFYFATAWGPSSANGAIFNPITGTIITTPVAVPCYPGFFGVIYTPIAYNPTYNTLYGFDAANGLLIFRPLI